MTRACKDETKENIVKNGIPIGSGKVSSTWSAGFGKLTQNPKLYARLILVV